MKFKYKSLSETDLLHGIKQAEAKIKAYERELNYRRNYRATRCSEGCGKEALPRGYRYHKFNYGIYGIVTFLCEDEHTLSSIDFEGGCIVRDVDDNKVVVVNYNDLDDYSKELYGTKGRIEI